MKNVLPVIIAVLLGIAAVLAVRSRLARSEAAPEAIATLIVTAQEIPAGTEITDQMLAWKTLPLSNRPATGLSWTERQLLLGQKSARDIPIGDFVLANDVLPRGRLAEQIRAGFWAVPLRLEDSFLLELIEVGDEIAVISTLEVPEQVVSANMQEESQVTVSMATVTLFPQVKVLGRQEGQIILELKPDQAQALIAAQSSQRLSVALRRTSDESFPARQQVKMVTAATFARALTNQLESVVIPLTKEELDRNLNSSGLKPTGN